MRYVEISTQAQLDALQPDEGYNSAAVRYLACEVDLSTLVMIGDKVKVPSCAVLFEVDIDGKRVAS